MSIYDSTLNGFSEPVVVKRRRDYPLWEQGDTRAQLIYDTIIILQEAYAPLAIGTPHSTIAGAVLARESAPSEYQTGWLQYDRVYAVPGIGYTEYGIASYQVPAMQVTGGAVSVTLGSFKGIYAGYPITLSPDLPVGRQIQIKLSWPANELSYLSRFIATTTAGARTVITPIKQYGTSGKRIDLPATVLGTKPLENLFQYTVVSANEYINRPVRNAAVPSKTVVTFVVGSPEDKTITEPFTIRDSAGADTTILTATSSPTAAEYQALIASGGWVQSEFQSFERWAGNIFLQKTTYVKAV